MRRVLMHFVGVIGKEVGDLCGSRHALTIASATDHLRSVAVAMILVVMLRIHVISRASGTGVNLRRLGIHP